jgi:crotonobetainyl-CoA:carnitine CoA-transferase CaiB-like acyl-CoA transferase
VSALPLAAVRVLDVGGPLSAYCTKLLADFGADVVKVEPPSGDPLRLEPPFSGGQSLAFAYYHGNKRGIRLDVSRPEAEPILAELAEAADVVVLTPSADARVVGLDPTAPSLSWAPAAAVVLCLTPFGLTGPLSDWVMTTFTSFAMSGQMYRMGVQAQPPVTVPGRQAWDQVAVHGVIAVLAALRVREFGGQLIDLSVHDVLSAQDDPFVRYSVASVVQQRGEGAGYPPSGPWECADGQIEFQVHTERHWTGFVDMLDNPAELSDPTYSQRLVRARESAPLRAWITALLAGRSRYDLVEAGQARGVPCGLLNTPRQFMDDPQMRARHFVATRPHHVLGSIRVPGDPFHASQPLVGFRRPPPGLGEHEVEVFETALGHSSADVAGWRETRLV